MFPEASVVSRVMVEMAGARVEVEEVPWRVEVERARLW